MTSSTSNKNYVKVSKNIYKTGNRYRVRVGKWSKYTTTKKDAFAARKNFQSTLANMPA